MLWSMLTEYILVFFVNKLSVWFVRFLFVCTSAPINPVKCPAVDPCAGRQGGVALWNDRLPRPQDLMDPGRTDCHPEHWETRDQPGDWLTHHQECWGMGYTSHAKSFSFGPLLGGVGKTQCGSVPSFVETSTLISICCYFSQTNKI
jgi:hypothetical protein